MSRRTKQTVVIVNADSAESEFIQRLQYTLAKAGFVTEEDHPMGEDRILVFAKATRRPV